MGDYSDDGGQRMMSSLEEEPSTITEHHDIVVDGDAFHVMDVCRRLLQTDNPVRRVETAHLVLERLRTNRADTADHVNALLRLLANYVPPTKDLTEEFTSLLFFSDHRVQIIYHLSKLTYQSRECVKLVIDAYVELLTSDRSLLVPILGSLADLPLKASDKDDIIEATESLLDAASEEDIPAVVQSLLSMIVPSCAARICIKIRRQANRLVSKTLALTFEVVLRHSVAGSCALTGFLRTIRQAELITAFDVIYLASLLSRATENQTAVRTITCIALKGRLTRQVVHDTVVMVQKQGWRDALSSLVRFSSALLASCFTGKTGAPFAPTVIRCAVDMLGFLISYRTVAQDEALSLLLSLVSQPRRLLHTASPSMTHSSAIGMCWDIVDSVAEKLSSIAKAQTRVLAPYSHLFLDHLHAIASAAPIESPSLNSEPTTFPTHILDSLCETMVLLTKQEPGILSLLLITIQKQLVVPVGAMNVNALAGAASVINNQSSSAQVKQLMAVFLAGHVLYQQIGDRRDRQSVLGWILKLLSTPTSDLTVLQVVRLVCGRMATMLLEREARMCQGLLATVFRRKGLVWKPFREAIHNEKTPDSNIEDVEMVPGFPGQKQAWISASMAVDIAEYVRKSHLGVKPFRWVARSKEVTSTTAITGYQSVIRDHSTKVSLLCGLFRSFCAFDSVAEQDSALECGFVVPRLPATLLECREISSVMLCTSLPHIWSLICAMQVTIVSANMMSHSTNDTNSHCKSNTPAAVQRRRKRILLRVQTCWDLFERLRGILEDSKHCIQAEAKVDTSEDENSLSSQRWLQLQLEVIESSATVRKKTISQSPWHWTGDEFGGLSSLNGLSMNVICSVFEGQWKQPTVLSLPLEVDLYQVLAYHLRSVKTSFVGLSDTHENVISENDIDTIRSMATNQDGQRTLKYLMCRLLELIDQLNECRAEIMSSLTAQDEDVEQNEDERESNGGEGEVENCESMLNERCGLLKAGIAALCSSLGAVIEACGRTRGLMEMVQSESSEACETRWYDKAIEFMAKGAISQSTQSRRIQATTSSAGHKEIVWRAFSRACAQTTDAEVACSLVDVLLRLVAHTRKQCELSQLCLALLHYPYQFTVMDEVFSSTSAIRFDRLPLFSLPISVAAPRGSGPSALNKLGVGSLPIRSLLHSIVGSWAIAPSVRHSLAHMVYLLDAMELLITSSDDAANLPSDLHRRQDDPAISDNDAISDDDSPMYWIAADGEHRVLKTLTNESLPWYLEAVFACALASLIRVKLPVNHQTMSTLTSSSSTSSPTRDGVNPFADIMFTFGTIRKCFQVFLAAEQAGFNIRARTAVALLRAGPYLIKTMRAAMERCLNWRLEQHEHSLNGAVSHFQGVLDAALMVAITMDAVVDSFQDKVVLKMQQNVRIRSAKSGTGARSHRYGWGNELVRQAHGGSRQRRRPVSKREARLLPYFRHAVEEIKVYSTEQCEIYQLELHEESAKTAVDRTMQELRLDSDDVERIVTYLSVAAESPVDVGTESSFEVLLGMQWASLVDNDEDDEDGEDEDIDANRDGELLSASGSGDDYDGALMSDNEEKEDVEGEADGESRSSGKKHPKSAGKRTLGTVATLSVRYKRKRG